MILERLPERINRIAIGVALALGAMDCWFFRDWNLNPDGVSYFDIARAVSTHGIGAVVNGYWSPLYPAIIGESLRIFSPSATAMFPLVRLLGFVVFVGTTFAFSRLLRIATSVSPGYHAAPLAARSLVILAAWEFYCVLILKAVGLFLVTPDMGVAMFVFWECGELVALASRPLGAFRWTRFGIALALGYWWKAILFPVSGVMLLVAFGIAWRRRDARRGPIAAGFAFALLALVVIMPVSQLTGRLTFGETGRLNQIWYVNRAPYIMFACAAPGTHLPDERVGSVRTNTVVLARPLTCAMPEQWKDATLPIWYDPSYWYQDTHTYVSVHETLGAVRRDLYYLRLAITDAAPLLVSALLLLTVVVAASRSSPSTGWPLAVVAVVPTAMYLVVYVELRHVTAFLMAGAVAALLALIAKPAVWRVRVLACVALIGAVECAAQLSTPLLTELSILRHEVKGDPRPSQVSAQVADLLEARGLLPGARVATINTVWNVDWAVRGEFVVRAYTPEYTESPVRTLAEFSDPCVLAGYDTALRAQRIEASVVLAPDGVHKAAGFEPLGSTGYFVRMIPRQAKPCHSPEPLK